jgi:hypothetical protein
MKEDTIPENNFEMKLKGKGQKRDLDTDGITGLKKCHTEARKNMEEDCSGGRV